MPERRRSARASERATRARELGALAQSDLLRGSASERRVGAAGGPSWIRLLPPRHAPNGRSRVSGAEDPPCRSGPVNAAAYSPDARTSSPPRRTARHASSRVRDGSLLAMLRHKGSSDRRVLQLRRALDRPRPVATRLCPSLDRVRAADPNVSPRRGCAGPGPVARRRVPRHARPTTRRCTCGAFRTVSRSLRFNDVPGNRLALSHDGARVAVIGADRYARVYSLAGEHPSGRARSLGSRAQRGLSARAPSCWRREARTSSRRCGRCRSSGSPMSSRVIRDRWWTSPSVRSASSWLRRAATARPGSGTLRPVPAQLSATLSGHSNFSQRVEFSPDGLYFVTSSRDGTARVWKTKAGHPKPCSPGTTGRSRPPVSDPTGSDVLTYSGDGTARIWDAGTTPSCALLADSPGWLRRLDSSARPCCHCRP